MRVKGFRRGSTRRQQGQTTRGGNLGLGEEKFVGGGLCKLELMLRMWYVGVDKVLVGGTGL